MNITVDQYPGYTIEIADHLSQPFKVLSRILTGVELDHPVELLENDVTRELIRKCNESISASIGKEFAHEAKIEDALSKWTNLSQFERVVIIVEASRNTEPLELPPIFGPGLGIDRI